MDKIKLLNEVVANQIAAGEVVNRPASVVKEMVENSIDAGAKTISVSYINGGKELIVVSDDGEGMSPIDARLAFDKHATSKIDTIDDVYTLRTFGFRGEALASIAAVSSVELVTRRQDEELGTHIIVEGSRFVSQNTIAAPVGSTFSVRNLFFNVPARRRVLEGSKYEHRHIGEEFKRVALCHPEVEFKLYGDDAAIYQLPASGLRQRIVGLTGKRGATTLLEVGTATSIVKIVGYVGHPSSARQSNSDQYLFVNGRFFKSGYFHKAIMEAYEKLIPSGSQPSYFLYFEVETDKIDVNIHPQKIEVRFEEGAAIWQILMSSVREALAKTGAVSMMEFDSEQIEIPVKLQSYERAYSMPPDTANPAYNPFAVVDSDPLMTISRNSAIAEFEETILEFADEQMIESRLIEEQSSDFEGMLMLGEGYIATQNRGELVVVNVKRLKEVILYQRYLLMLGNNSSTTQRLLFPETLFLSIDDMRLLEERYDDFAALGFEYRTDDEGALEVLGIPADFAVGELRPLLYDMIDALRDERSLDSDTIRRTHLAEILSREAARCGTTPSREDIVAMLDIVREGGQYNYTSDGRAVMVKIGIEEIENKF